jgi:hypothetical protein
LISASAFGGLVDLQPLAQLGVLRGDADRAAPGVAVIAPARGNADGALGSAVGVMEPFEIGAHGACLAVIPSGPLRPELHVIHGQ